MEEVRRIFKPEFINRLDEMIVFHVLNKENVHEITCILVRNFVKRVREQMNMELEVADAVVDFVAKKGFDKDYGARPIRRTLQNQLEDLLAESALNGEIHMGDRVRADVRDKKIALEKILQNS